MRDDPALEAFCAFFEKLDKSYTKYLYRAYTEDVDFCDPLHHIRGRDALERYFAALYERVEECRFTFGDRLRDGDLAFVAWTLHLVHPALDRGRTVTVEGCSRLRFRATADGERVCEHRDYFDAGALLYEHVPLLGGAIRQIKRRLA
ncbi:nuclear transport factor 2 family protein [Modicisalibacter coralii]|uniref:nuclear transport factor 2 family protein n=1 Tax=Modicisalibacter coralii TaxID=2304602 RepID=UPI00100B7B5E|nr:nuclear transport factor 2 family protein [Halomonas coralii]